MIHYRDVMIRAAIQTLLDRAQPQRALILQIARYVVVGGFVTSLQVLVYWMLATSAGWHLQLANIAGYGVAVASGYVLHGRITFQTRPAPDNRAQPGRAVKFVAVSLLSLALNAAWVWLCVSWLGGAEWTPIPLMALVTPAFVFLLNRQWVFRT